jgi:hypothetical protein
MTFYCHVVELVIVLLFSLRKSRYIGALYPLCSNVVMWFFLVLFCSGILGKGMLRVYPWGRIPTASVGNGVHDGGQQWVAEGDEGGGDNRDAIGNGDSQDGGTTEDWVGAPPPGTGAVTAAAANPYLGMQVGRLYLPLPQPSGRRCSLLDGGWPLNCSRMTCSSRH